MRGTGKPPALVDGAECRVSLRRQDMTEEERSYRWDAGKPALTESRPVTTDGPGSARTWHFVHTLDDRGNRIRYEVFDEQTPVLAEAFVNRYDGDRLSQVEYLGEVTQVAVRIDRFSYDDAGRVREVDAAPVEPGSLLRVTTTGSYGPDGRLESTRLRVEGRHGTLVTLLAHDDAGRLTGMTQDGNPYDFGDADGKPERHVRWTYDGTGRITTSRSEGTLGDVVGPYNNYDQISAPAATPSRPGSPPSSSSRRGSRSPDRTRVVGLRRV